MRVSFFEQESQHFPSDNSLVYYEHSVVRHLQLDYPRVRYARTEALPSVRQPGSVH